jgi:ABC-type sugar transport system permease subunit
MKRSDYLLIICTLAFLFIVSFQIALASAEENFFKNNARTIIALAALVVSIATVLSTILNNNRIKRQNELSILPKLLFNIKIESISEFELALNNGLPPLDHPNKITLSLINVGVGFAVVTDL